MRNLFAITLLTAVFLSRGGFGSEPKIESPAEGRILISSAKDGLADLFLVDPATGDRKNITRSEREEEIDPAWSPDGKRIAFANRAVGGKLEIFVCDADGSNRQRISAQPEQQSIATSPSWSSDCKKVAYSRSLPNAHFEIHVVQASGENDEVVMENASHPAWSPDGKRIAFLKHGPGTHRQIAVMDPDGSNVKVLVDEVGEVEVCRPAWSPDGQVLCYPGQTDYGWHLFLVPSVGGKPRQLTHIVGFNFHPVWLSNEQILFTHMNQPGAPGGGYTSVNRDGTHFDLHPLGRIEHPHPLIRPAVYIPLKPSNNRASTHSDPVKQAGFVAGVEKSSLEIGIKPVNIVPPSAPGSIPALAWAADGKRFVVAHESGTIIVAGFDGKTVKPGEVFRGHEGAVEAVAINADQSLIYSAGVDKTLRKWDLKLKSSVAIEKEPSRILSIALSEDGEQLATGDLSGMLRIRHPETIKLIREIKICDEKRGGVYAVAYSKDQKMVFAGCGRWDVPVLNGSVSCRSAITGEMIWKSSKSIGGIFSLAISPDGTKLAASCLDGYIRIWNSEDGKEIAAWKGHSDRATGLAWALDGKVLITSGFDHTIRIWDPLFGSELHTIAAHATPVIRIATSPDGEYVVSGDREGALMIWKLSLKSSAEHSR